MRSRRTHASRTSRVTNIAAICGTVAALIAFLTPASADAIVGGKVLKATAYPAVVQVVGNNFVGGTGAFCGGGLITRRIVITARHCLGTNPAGMVKQLRPLSVVSGRQWAPYLRNPNSGIHVDVTKVALAPINRRLKMPFPDDVALLYLRRPMPIKPLRLGAPSEARTGAHVFTLGWGLIRDNQSSTAANELHGEMMQVRSTQLCARLAKGAYDATTRLCLAASHPRRDPRGPCEGDSGTPLLSVRSHAVLGVVTTGSGLCGRGASLYTRVSSGPMRLWVERQISRWSR